MRAFNNRGVDYRTSHDMEDIIYVLENRKKIVEEIAKDDVRIAYFVKDQLHKIIDKGILHEVLVSHIHPLMIEERLPLVEEKINQILNQ